MRKKAKKKLSKKKAVLAQRMMVVWKVFNSNYKEMGCFSYPEKKKAYKMAEVFEKKNKGKHYVNAVRVKMPVERRGQAISKSESATKSTI